jgi:hypothetical protein
VAYVGMGGDMLPLLLFAAARAGRPFAPLNYRLSGQALRELIDRRSAPNADSGMPRRCRSVAH